MDKRETERIAANCHLKMATRFGQTSINVGNVKKTKTRTQHRADSIWTAKL